MRLVPRLVLLALLLAGASTASSAASTSTVSGASSNPVLRTIKFPERVVTVNGQKAVLRGGIVPRSSQVDPYTSPNTCHWSGDGNDHTCFQIFGPNGTNCVQQFYASSDKYDKPATINLAVTGPAGFGGLNADGWHTVYPAEALWESLTTIPLGSCKYYPVGTYCGVTWLNVWGYLYASACNSVHT